MKRAAIVVKGDVQRVGYRDVAEKLARKLGLTGFVENLKPYDVRIVCEGEEEKIKQFLKQINIQKSPILVEKIETDFDKPTGEFQYFEIKRGEPMEEIGERIDIAGNILFNIDRGVGEVKVGIDEIKYLQKETLGLQKETVKGITEVKESVNGLRKDITQSFSELKTEVVDRYGEIALLIKQVLVESKEERKQNREMMEKLIKAILEKK